MPTATSTETHPPALTHPRTHPRTGIVAGDAASAPTVAELMNQGRHSWSFEFFPPKTDEGERQLWQTIRELESSGPPFVSVTYGAGGSTQDRTVRLIERIAAETTLTPVGHLTCVGARGAELRHVIGAYVASGVRNILALRGDPPGGPGAPWTPHPDGLRNADELVALARSLGDVCVGVAAFPDGHPESPDREEDALALARKADAGAEFAITQFFFEVAEYDDLMQRAAGHGCTIPVIPGILPITNVSQLVRSPSSRERRSRTPCCSGCIRWPTTQRPCAASVSRWRPNCVAI